MAVAAAVAFALASCSTMERATVPIRFVAAVPVFDIAGRLSARHAESAVAASFRWKHDGARDEVELSSPLGQTIAQMEGSPGAVTLVAADGSKLSAGDWPTLTERALHFPLPVEGLASWIQGTPREGSTYSAEARADGLPGALRQDGWTIVYQAYDSAGGATRPTRMTLSYPDVELRIAIETWQQ